MGPVLQATPGTLNSGPTSCCQPVRPARRVAAGVLLPSRNRATVGPSGPGTGRSSAREPNWRASSRSADGAANTPLMEGGVCEMETVMSVRNLGLCAALAMSYASSALAASQDPQIDQGALVDQLHSSDFAKRRAAVDA